MRGTAPEIALGFRELFKLGYLTVVTDHDRRRVVRVAEGKTSEVLKRFFQELGPEGCAAIEIVTMDMSAAYRKAVQESAPAAEIAYDHFHITRLANEALNEVRRDLVTLLRLGGQLPEGQNGQ